MFQMVSKECKASLLAQAVNYFLMIDSHVENLSTYTAQKRHIIVFSLMNLTLNGILPMQHLYDMVVDYCVVYIELHSALSSLKRIHKYLEICNLAEAPHHQQHNLGNLIKSIMTCN